MSLKVKIRKQARLAIEIVRYLRNSIGKAAEIAEQEKWIQVDVVSGLLDKAIEQIDEIMLNDAISYGEVRRKVLIVLGVEGRETKK